MHVARCMFHEQRCTLHVACFVSNRARCMLHVACCMLHVACCMLREQRCACRIRCRGASCHWRTSRHRTPSLSIGALLRGCPRQLTLTAAAAHSATRAKALVACTGDTFTRAHTHLWTRTHARAHARNVACECTCVCVARRALLWSRVLCAGEPRSRVRVGQPIDHEFPEYRFSHRR